MASDLDYDVIIVGAGISGVNFAYRLQENHPNMTFCIVESRHEMGGTWSLFKYPGIRSDSDLYTFGFQWNPWLQKEAIASGPHILSYLNESARKAGLDDKIKYNHQVTQMSWDTPSATWTLDVSVGGGGNDPATRQTILLRSRFVLMGTGYYDFKEPLKTEIPGIDSFGGDVIHPQFWPEDYSYKGKNVVIIGSGATAVTLLPSMAEEAGHVTMLQRSPTYIISRVGQSPIERLARAWLPPWMAYHVIRAKCILFSIFMVTYADWFPARANRLALGATAKQLPEGASLERDFTPSYNLWEQRVCLSPDGDFYQSLRQGKASVKTDHIDTVTRNSIKLKSGAELHPDVIVTATGLKLRMAGGIDIVVDGKPYDMSAHFAWNNSMLDDLPNVMLAWGYVNASWTLGADTTSLLFCRLITAMNKKGAKAIVARRRTAGEINMSKVPILNLNSTYVRKGVGNIPSCGDQPQWLPRTNYIKDLARATLGDVESGLEWIK